MKKIGIALLIIIYTSTFNVVFAKNKTQEEIIPPKWEDYVPEKYQHPRSDFKRKTAYSEMAAGFILTDLIITAPIGIPLIVHSASKVKNISYAEKKEKFEKGLVYANSINNSELKKDFCKTLLKDCKLSERKKQKLAKKRIKRIEKEKRKVEKQLEKANRLEEKSNDVGTI